MINLSTEEIRHQKHAVSNPDVAERLLNKGMVGFLGLSDEKGPYVVPLNYVWHNDAIYVHGSKMGRKADILMKSPNATFVVAEFYGTVADPVPAETGSSYLSVMIFGKMVPVQDADESTAALDALLSKYVPGYFKNPLEKQHVINYVSSLGSQVGVYRLSPDKITAKQCEEVAENMFYPGRTQYGDLRDLLKK